RPSLRAYRALRLSPRRARPLCDADADRARTARAARADAGAGGGDALFGQPDRPVPPRCPGRHSRGPRPRPRADDMKNQADPARTIAFQGAPGAYSDLACRHVFPEMTSLPCVQFEDALGAVRDGTAALGM